MNRRKNELSFVTFKNGLITFERQFTCRTYKSNSLRKGLRIAKILSRNGMREMSRFSNRIVYVKEI